MDKTGIQYQNVFVSPKAYCMICLQVLRVYVTAGCRRITDLPVKLQLSFWAPIPCTSNRRKRERERKKDRQRERGRDGLISARLSCMKAYLLWACFNLLYIWYWDDLKQYLMAGIEWINKHNMFS